MREINLKKENLSCCDDILFTENGIEFEFETWFDVDSYFGENTKDKDDEWINMYATYYPIDKHIGCVYTVNKPNITEWNDWILTKEEEVMLYDLMNEYCLQLQGESMLEAASNWMMEKFSQEGK